MGKSENRYADGELLAAIRLGQPLEAPIQYLYQAHFDNLTHFVRINKGSQEDAEDIFQSLLKFFMMKSVCVA